MVLPFHRAVNVVMTALPLHLPLCSDWKLSEAMASCCCHHLALLGAMASPEQCVEAWVYVWSSE